MVCHYRNWGDKSDPEDERSEGNSEDERSEESSEDDYKERSRMFFVAVDARTGKEKSRLEMDADCILAEQWYYGLKLVDKTSGKAFAFVFSDALVEQELCGDIDNPDPPHTDFTVEKKNLHTRCTQGEGSPSKSSASKRLASNHENASASKSLRR
jgi:hypothetical protein